jgi:FMN reductase
MTRIAIIVGAVTPPGRLNGAINGAAQRARDAGHEVDVLELNALRLDFADGRPAAEHDDDSARVIETVSNAEAVLIASPVYRGTFTGALKNVIDLLPPDALYSKPTGIVAMGGSQHHYLGVDFHLRDVLAWFGALVAPTSVYLAGSDFSDGKPSDAANEQLDDLVATLVTLVAATGGAKLGPTPLSKRY